MTTTCVPAAKGSARTLLRPKFKASVTSLSKVPATCLRLPFVMLGTSPWKVFESSTSLIPLVFPVLLLGVKFLTRHGSVLTQIEILSLDKHSDKYLCRCQENFRSWLSPLIASSTYLGVKNCCFGTYFGGQFICKVNILGVEIQNFGSNNFATLGPS